MKAFGCYVLECDRYYVYPSWLAAFSRRNLVQCVVINDNAMSDSSGRTTTEIMILEYTGRPCDAQPINLDASRCAQVVDIGGNPTAMVSR